MAQTKKKRQTKHRGNAAGVVEVRGRTSKPLSPEQRKKDEKAASRAARLVRPPSWKISFRNAGLMAVVLFLFVMLTSHSKHGGRGGVVLTALILAIIAFAAYVPIGYYLEKMMWKRRLNAPASAGVKRGR